MRITAGLLTSVLLPLAGFAADGAAPNPVPLTRPELKQALEDLKGRRPRSPLPELTDEEKNELDERAASYESRLRYHFLPGGNGARGGAGVAREPDPNMTLDNAFDTQLLWIVP